MGPFDHIPRKLAIPDLQFEGVGGERDGWIYFPCIRKAPREPIAAEVDDERVVLEVRSPKERGPKAPLLMARVVR